MSYEPISYFFETIRHKSISIAAHELGITQPALSRYLKKAEQKVGAKLYTYRNKQIILTPEGHLFEDFLKERLHLEKNFINYIQQKNSVIEGNITLSTSLDPSNGWFMPVICKYLEAHPLVKLSIITTDSNIKLGHQCDVVLSSKMTGPHIHSLFLKRTGIKFFASKKYLKKYGLPLCMTDLKHHRLIFLANNKDEDTYNKDNVSYLNTNDTETLKSFLEVPTVTALKEAALNNMGIVFINSIHINPKETHLVEVLPGHQFGYKDLYLSYLQKYKKMQPLHSFLSFLKKLKNF